MGRILAFKVYGMGYFWTQLSDGAPLVVYGVDLQLTGAVLDAMKNHGVAPDFFCDGRHELTGKEYEGRMILSPEVLADKYTNAHVVICPSAEFMTVRNRLWTAGMTRLYPAFEVLEDLVGLKLDRAKETINNAIHIQKELLASQRVFLPMVNVVITEFCSLNCRLCSNLMPFIRDKKQYNIDTVVKDMHVLCDSVDSVISAHIMGGEPFLYPELPRLITSLSSLGNLKQIAMVTNATILPSEKVIRALADSGKGFVFISNYGPELSKQADALKIALKGRVHFDEQPVDQWRDFGDMTDRKRTPTEKRDTFIACPGKNCATLLDGRLYRCPLSGFATRIGRIPHFSNEVVNLRDNVDFGRIREDIRSLFFQRDYLDACGFCDGTGLHLPSVRGGEQIPRSYH